VAGLAADLDLVVALAIDLAVAVNLALGVAVDAGEAALEVHVRGCSV
jgi:hypothetical protein